MPYTPIVGTLGYVVRDGRVLLVHRTARGDDAHLGKYNGLGGKLEAGEDVVACLRRELREEAGLEATSLRLRGTVSWPGFGAGGMNGPGGPGGGRPMRRAGWAARCIPDSFVVIFRLTWLACCEGRGFLGVFDNRAPNGVCGDCRTARCTAQFSAAPGRGWGIVHG